MPGKIIKPIWPRLAHFPKLRAEELNHVSVAIIEMWSVALRNRGCEVDVGAPRGLGERFKVVEEGVNVFGECLGVEKAETVMVRGVVVPGCGRNWFPRKIGSAFLADVVEVFGES